MAGIDSNPFNSNTFKSIWNRHFNDDGELYDFESIVGPSFYKNKYLPLLTNSGRRFTQGLAYRIREGKSPHDLHGKVFLCYDVPEYFANVKSLDHHIKLTKIRQYHGYYANLEGFESARDYMLKHIRPKSRRLITRSKTRLETCFEVVYETLIGPEVPKKVYENIFKKLKSLLDKRYSEKNTKNIYLSPKFWTYLEELIYPLMLEGKANIIIIYANGEPISISINYISENVLFSAHPVFDTDFSCFNLGHINTLYTMQWCIDNNIKIFDFSKGHYDYKKRWSSNPYYVDYHVIYDSKSPVSLAISGLLISLFTLKRFMRSLNVDSFYHKLKTIFVVHNENESKHYKLELLNNLEDFEQMEKKSLSPNEVLKLRKVINEFLYKTQECIKNISLFHLEPEKDVYLIYGFTNKAKISPNNK